jgi:Zn-dependent protease
VQQEEGDALGGSFRVAEIAGVAVKVHILFLAWVGMGLLQARSPVAELTSTVVLVLSVLLHELGHVAGARLVGGRAFEIVLWPLGGFTRSKTPDTWRAELGLTACGPAVNFLLILVALALLATQGMLDLERPLTMLQGGRATTALGLVASDLLYWNTVLFVFNVLPSYPMDGGKLFRAGLWPLLGWRRATLVATTLALGFGALYAGLGLYLQAISLTIIGLLVLWASWQELQRARMAGGWRRE